MINILDSSVYNRISAGEVVEKPASVVKELVENCIDAGATNIRVDITGGGIQKIAVFDNGIGIVYEDLTKTILPHATSKLSKAEDLDGITTLGFRGEALASIASVSKLTIRSKHVDADIGYEFNSLGGDIDDIIPSNIPEGTQVIVSDLFFNTPARAKFLKKPKQEEATITDYLQKLAFANSNISFSYCVDGKQVFRTHGKGLYSAIESIYGYKNAKETIEVFNQDGKVKVNGFVGNPSYVKSNRNHQTIIVNGRIISDISLSSTAANAFGERLMKRTFPVFILEISLPHTDVDVNVHPAKSEVRFLYPSKIYGCVFNAIKKGLEDYEIALRGLLVSTTNIVEGFSDIPITTTDQLNAIKSDSQLKPVEEAYNTNNPDQLFDQTILDNKGLFDKQQFSSINLSEKSLLSKKLYDTLTKSNIVEKSTIESYSLSNDFSTAQSNVSIIKDTESISKQIEEQQSVFEDISYKIIGQAFSCYILIEASDNLLLIDQHAAHERILYDKLSSLNSQILSQSLLCPIVLDFAPEDYVKISNNLDLFTEIGFDIEEFGAYSLKINAMPMDLTDIKIERFFNDFLSDTNTLNDLDLIKDRLIKSACKNAIKSGDNISEDMIKYIIDKLFTEKTVLQCPHGRPLIIKLTKNELERMFKRKV